MKTLLLIALLTGIAHGGEKVEDYHERVRDEFATIVNKADDQLDKAQEARDKKVKRAIATHVKSLKKVQDHYTKKVNLEKAIAVKKEIEMLKRLIAKKPKVKRRVVVVKKKTSIRIGRPEAVPVDAISFNTSYYKFYHGRVSYEEAIAKCKELGGHLMTIESRGEMLWFSKVRAGNSELRLTYFHLGVELPKQARVYWTSGNVKWITGKKFERRIAEKYWGTKQPSSVIEAGSYKYRHVMVQPNSEWITTKGNDERINCFVCEWNTK